MSKLADRLRGGRTTENKKEVEAEQYLTFILAEEEYGVAILNVQEIRGWEPVMTIPNGPAFLRGVMNLRGSVIPIVDLRVRFGLPVREPSVTTVVVILRVQTDEGEKLVGVVVDAVAEVYDIEKTHIQPAPSMEGDDRMDYIAGIATLKSKMISLIKIEKLFDVARLSRVKGAAIAENV